MGLLISCKSHETTFHTLEGLVLVDLDALVPAFLDLAFPVGVLLAPGAAATGSSPGQPCSGNSTV